MERTRGIWWIPCNHVTYVMIQKASDIPPVYPTTAAILMLWYVWAMNPVVSNAWVFSFYSAMKMKQLTLINSVILNHNAKHSTNAPDSQVDGVNMGPIWGWQDPKWALCWPNEPCYPKGNCDQIASTESMSEILFTMMSQQLINIYNKVTSIFISWLNRISDNVLGDIKGI